jgi:phage repressor protein C with HTH and peptisase S24 domain
MRPVIEDGDRVLVAPVEAARLRPGDIVKFQFGDELRMHRLVERREGRLIFRGDAADGEETVSASAVIGLAVAVERRGRVRRLRRRRGYWWLFAPGQRLGIFLQRRL